MKYFCVADVHGFFFEMIEALKNAGFEKDNPEHILICLGDIVDRGSQPKEMIDYFRSFKDDKLILIKGNHEDLMLSCLMTHRYTSRDLYNGTFKTICDLADLDTEKGEMFFYSACEVARESGFMELYNKSLDYYELGNYIFVHGYIPLERDEDGRYVFDPKWRETNLSRWEEARWTNGILCSEFGITEPGKVIVCGHISSAYGYEKFKGIKHCYKPYVTDTLIALDSCTVISGKVNVLVLQNIENKVYLENIIEDNHNDNNYHHNDNNYHHNDNINQKQKLVKINNATSTDTDN